MVSENHENAMKSEAVTATYRKDADKAAHPYGAKNQHSARYIAIWLYSLCALVAVMVSVGGATRLTDSGLSITQWDLLMGTLPPMSDAKWQEEFTLYRQIPEYERVNKGMSLDEFKNIYWWEWSHRNLGRFIGLAFMIPFTIFLLRGDIARASLRWKLSGALVLLLMQGLMGWLMVKSGLTERVDVSQYRLAAHLFLAFLLFSCLLWMAFNLTLARSKVATAKAYSWAKLLTGLVVIQIILGAFVAGLRAGKSFNTWPMMDGAFFPSSYFSANPGLHDLFETIAAVQFNHRIIAYLVAVAAIVFWFKCRAFGKDVSRRVGWIVMAVFAQVLLGIWALIAAVPIGLGLAHQLGALSILALCVYFLYWSRPTKSVKS